MTETRIVALEDVQFSHGPWEWPFAHERRAEIAAHFAARRVTTPGLWNGRVFLARDYALEGASLRGRFFETDFANFIAWRDWDFPDPSVTNCFSMGAIRSADGAFILGVMAQHTANPGRIYFPAGTPDPDDIVGDSVDLLGNIVREVAEETGLTASDFAMQAGWTAVLAGPRLALLKVLQTRADAETLRAAIRRHLARQVEPELADVRIVRGPADFDAAMPEFMTAFMLRALAV